MDTLPNRWWLDEKHLRAELAEHGSLADAARAHGVNPGTVQKGWQGTIGENLHQRAATSQAKIRSPVHAQEPGLHVDFKRGQAILITDPTQNPLLGDVDTIIRERGLDPTEWIVDRVKVNEWQGFLKDKEGEPKIVTLRQLTAHLCRRPPLDLIFPASEVRMRPIPKLLARKKAKRLIALIGDQQADYHDERLHRAFLRWAAAVQPDELILLGDVADFPTISRHSDRPHWDSTPQRCVDVAYRLLSEYRDALPNTQMRKLRGNHDFRIESELLTRAERMFGLAPAERNGVEEVPGYSIRRLLHLDELHIELIGREGDKWELAEIEVVPGLWARHQPPNDKKLLRLNRDVVAGDTHRQGITQVTVFDGDDKPVVRTLVQAGCMCRTDGLGYTEHPDWQAGFATASVANDGSISYDLATWRDGRLAWRGERWK